MLHSLFRAGLAMSIFGLLLVPGMASAQDRRVRHVQDDARIFSKEAITEANAVITKIHDKHKKDLFIETVKEGPEKADKAEETRWARERFNDHKVDGVYVVFCKQPHFFGIQVGNKTLKDGYFAEANIRELEKIIESKQKPDKMLERIADYTLDTMNKHLPVAAPPVQPKPRAAEQAPAPVVHHGDGRPGTNWLALILPWVCVIAGGALVIWVIFAIIRALTGMGGGGGYGYGGGGMMGGGGGGLFTGMLGGLFGAMAGMWIYNNMFGGHASYGSDGNVNWGGGNQGGAGGDTDTGASGGGDNWGDGDAAGADAGGGKGDDGGDGGGKGDDGGGGDWGGGDAGGGDAGGGGGGDWGGGGDAGGGGGGDWGGGGGGDFGGGGGGCGGGGGGGDW